LNLVQAFEIDETIVIASLDSNDFDGTAQRQAKETDKDDRETCGEDTVMAECHRYPLRVQQSKLDGWWFIFVDEVPGLGVLGPNYEDLLDRLKLVAGNLFRARGETVTDIKIIPSERPALQVFH
jgi:predicted RNase H-like HicB family nuclease